MKGKSKVLNPMGFINAYMGSNFFCNLDAELSGISTQEFQVWRLD